MTDEEQQSALLAVFGELSQGVCLLDGQGTIQFCNNAFSGLTGHATDSLARTAFGTPWSGRQLQQLTENGLPAERLRELIHLPDGTIRPVLLSLRQLKTKPPLIMVTASPAAEEPSSRQGDSDERRRRRILDSARVIPWEMDVPSMTFIYVGSQAPSVLGYSLDSWKEADFLSHILLPEDEEPVLQILEECHRSQEERDLEFRVYDLSGSVRILCAQAVPGAQGTLRGLLVDVTDLRQDEEERRLIEQRLLHTQKLESLGLLAGGIAHDFNNYLMAILGNVGLALMETPEGAKPHHYLVQLEKAAQRASELTRELLVYSGKRQPVLQHIDLSSLVQEMPELLQTIISKRAVVQYQLAMHLPAIEADATQIRQVLMNLITNASDALQDNAGILTIRTGFSTLRDEPEGDVFLVENLLPGKYVYFEVSDTGCGMNAETRSRLFDPFFTTKSRGRGLGLAAVLGIVRAHHGGVILDSREGEGTTIRVLFPPSGRYSRAIENTPLPIRGRPVERGNVLLVDDETSVIEIATSVLQRGGFTVLTARSGREALQILRERHKEIIAVVMDIIMPEMDGGEAYRRLREISDRVPVLFSSGYHDSLFMQDFAGDRRTAFIEKPYRPRDLQEKLIALIRDWGP